MHRLIALALVAFAASATPAFAHGRTACEKAFVVRAAVVQQHGKRAPGRNICRYGVRHSDGSITKAEYGQKKRYLNQLRLLVAPEPYLATIAGSPYNPPAGTASAHYTPTGLAACIVHWESGGNPMASNGSHTGIAQWTYEAWHRHGGGRFADTPTGATYQQQLQVLNDGLARYGCADWCPFDPC